MGKRKKGYKETERREKGMREREREKKRGCREIESKEDIRY